MQPNKLSMSYNPGSSSPYNGPSSAISKPGGEGLELRRKGLVTPLFIKWANALMNSRLDDVLMIQNYQLDQFSIVGRLVKIDLSTALRTLLTIDDSTGQLDVIIYNNKNGEVSKIIADLDLKNNMYLKIICTLKAYQTQKLIIAHSVEHVKDFNQVTHHILFTCLNEQYRTKGSLPNIGEQKPRGPTQNPGTPHRGQEFSAMNSNVNGHYGAYNPSNHGNGHYGGHNAVAEHARGMQTGYYPQGGYMDPAGGHMGGGDRVVIQLKMIAHSNPSKSFRYLDVQRVLGTSNLAQVNQVITSLENQGTIMRISETEFAFIST